MSERTVTIDLATAILIRRAFVPHNPRRMRNTTEETRQAALRFIELVESECHRVAAEAEAVLRAQSSSGNGEKS